MTLNEAKSLYQECEDFENGFPVEADSELRKMTEKFFICSTVSTMRIMTSMIYRRIAQEYMEK